MFFSLPLSQSIDNRFFSSINCILWRIKELCKRFYILNLPTISFSWVANFAMSSALRLN